MREGSNPLIEVYLHIVFSTKHRANIIHPEIEAELHRYIAVVIANEHGVGYDARYPWD